MPSWDLQHHGYALASTIGQSSWPPWIMHGGSLSGVSFVMISFSGSRYCFFLGSYASTDFKNKIKKILLLYYIYDPHLLKARGQLFVSAGLFASFVKVHYLAAGGWSWPLACIQPSMKALSTYGPVYRMAQIFSREILVTAALYACMIVFVLSSLRWHLLLVQCSFAREQDVESKTPLLRIHWFHSRYMSVDSLVGAGTTINFGACLGWEIANLHRMPSSPQYKNTGCKQLLMGL